MGNFTNEGHRRKILVIDDDTDIVEIVELILEGRSFDVYGCQNASNIMEVIKSFAPDLILLDIILEHESGIQICYELKKKINIPVIFISAQPREKIPIKLCNANDFIQKPFGVKELLNTIEHHLNSKSEHDLSYYV